MLFLGAHRHCTDDTECFVYRAAVNGTRALWADRLGGRSVRFFRLCACSRSSHCCGSRMRCHSLKWHLYRHKEVSKNISVERYASLRVCHDIQYSAGGHQHFGNVKLPLSSGSYTGL